jgi:WD40 repeat protein
LSIIELKNGNLATSNKDSIIRIWSLETKLQIRELTGHSDEVRALIQLKNGHLASGSCDAGIKIWNDTNGVLIKSLEGHENCVNDLISSNNETRLFSCSSDKTVKIWNLKSYLTIKIIKVSPGEGISSLLFLNQMNLAIGLRYWLRHGTIAI